ncbi:2-hydroxychromene-2-carboxylate isomerase [Candidatus Pelagibacter sp. Uisw_090]|uniref:2-hydroxychromene-2-carboxylate isomerase n=1 Tax=Candidatus Pelagibacter sp. Uisw_090 TaxID=3230993 RepID=UPI0039EAD169
MTKEVDFYFDFISPYTYLAHKKIQSLPKNIKINYKPILLGGLHNLQGVVAPAFIKPKLKHMMNDCNLIAKKNKFDFTWNTKFPLNSLYIMRGYFCVDSDIKGLYIDSMFNAYWKNNLDISNEQILIGILEECEIKKDKFYQDIKDQKIKDTLKDVTKDAYDKEIFGAPTFIVNNKIFWGQDRLEFALDELNR